MTLLSFWYDFDQAGGVGAGDAAGLATFSSYPQRFHLFVQIGALHA